MRCGTSQLVSRDDRIKKEIIGLKVLKERGE